MTFNNPERDRGNSRSYEKVADSLTLDVLAGLSEEFALNGQREENGDTITFQNDLRLSDERRLYATKYYTHDASDVRPGDKLGDIVICDVIQYKVTGEPVPNAPHLYTNYYIVNELHDEFGAQSVRVGKRQFMCSSSEIVYKVANSHVASNPGSEFENSTELDTITEREAGELIELIARKLDEIQ